MRNKSVWRGLLLAGLLNLSLGSTVALADNTALTQKLAALEKSTGGRLGVAPLKRWRRRRFCIIALASRICWRRKSASVRRIGWHGRR